MSDPLAQFRKRPVEPRGSIAAPEQPQGYVAFGAKDNVARLRIRRANDPTRAPGYRDLWDIIYDGPFGTNFTLIFAFITVLVRGRNLQPVVAALEAGMVDFIQEYDPDTWPKPNDANAPFIESIEIAVPEGGPVMPESGGSESKGVGKPH